jgi:hypothetical protein
LRQVLPSAVSPTLIQAARQRVDDITDHDAMQLTGDLRLHPDILALFNDSSLGPLLDHALGRRHSVTAAQVAVLFPQQILEDHFRTTVSTSADDRVAGTAAREFGTAAAAYSLLLFGRFLVTFSPKNRRF